jgi:hypothetical protein
MALQHLAIITTCTARKALSSDSVSLADIPANVDPEKRVSQWVKALDRGEGRSLPVETVYKGDHWQESLRALAAAKAHGFDASLWVLSAGYGLLPVSAGTLIRPYEATFGTVSANSVSLDVPSALRQEYNRAWWLALRSSSAMRDFGPRSLAEVAEARLGDLAMLVIASDAYLRVVADEILAAASVLKDPSRLMVLSAGVGTSRRRHLGAFILNTDSRLQRKLGGTRISLNARTATWLLNRTAQNDFSREHLSGLLQAELGQLPHLCRPPIVRMTNDEILAFIQNELSKGKASATVLLRRLREGKGWSCEQGRFRNLFDQAMSTDSPSGN